MKIEININTTQNFDEYRAERWLRWFAQTLLMAEDMTCDFKVNGEYFCAYSTN